MKLTWNEPKISIENFEPNEYVAACVTGTIACAIPGHDPYECDGDSPDRGFDYTIDISRWSGPIIEPDNKPGGGTHGMCGNSTPITFSDVNGSGSGFETNNNQIDRNRPIYNILGYDLKAGTYPVTWNSNNGSYEYNHYGYLTITEIDKSRPNHS